MDALRDHVGAIKIIPKSGHGAYIHQVLTAELAAALTEEDLSIGYTDAIKVMDDTCVIGDLVHPVDPKIDEELKLEREWFTDA